MKRHYFFRQCVYTIIAAATIVLFAACSGSSSSAPFEQIANAVSTQKDVRKALTEFYRSEITAEADQATPTGLTLTTPFRVTKATITANGIDYQMSANIRISDRQRVNDDNTEPRIVGVGDNNLVIELRGKTFVNNQVLTLYSSIDKANAPFLAKINKIVVCSRESALFRQAR